MCKTTFAKAIINKLREAIGNDGGSFTEGTANVAMQTVAAAITEYLIANTKVEVAYAGVIPGPPPVPDPVVLDTFTIAGSCMPTGVCSDFNEWINKIESNIIAGFALAPMGELGVVFAQKPFANKGILITQESLKAVHDINDKEPQQVVWEVVCQGILDWLNTVAINPVSGPATRPGGPSSGVANIAKITVM